MANLTREIGRLQLAVKRLQAQATLGMLNGKIVASVAASVLTVAVKTLSGADPSASDPVYILFRDATAANGGYVLRTVTSALSVTISSGSTLGTTNSTAFRLWITAHDDGGTVRLGVSNRSNSSQIWALGDYILASSTAEGGAGAADSAGVIYTGTAVTSKPMRVLGFMTWNSGLATAGTWSAGPVIQQFEKGMPLPGMPTGNTIQAASTDSTITTSSTFQNTGAQVSITPTSPANLFKVHTTGGIRCDTAATGAEVAIFRGTNEIGARQQWYSPATNVAAITSAMTALDKPNTASAVTYQVKIRNGSANGITVYYGTSSGGNLQQVLVEELMG
jgi:hypothetical protein